MKMGPMKTPKLLFEGTAFEEKSLKKKKSEHVGSISNTSEMDRDHFFQSALKDNFFLVSMSKRLWCTRTDYNSKLQSG